MRNGRISFRYANPLKEKFGPEFFRALPRAPGVYFMVGEGDREKDETILYVGKAKDLRARLSTYAQAKPGAASDHTLEMLECVRRIRWEILATERAALERESELLHAIRPPYNIAGIEEAHYLYVGIRPRGRCRVDFMLSSHDGIRAQGYEVFGCFKHRRLVKSGYTALLRLAHAAQARPRRYSLPARITRASPPWTYGAELPDEWLEPLRRFLAGRDLAFLRILVEAMLDNENLPPFMRPALQDDLELARRFFELGPEATRRMRVASGLRRNLVSHRQMDRWIADSLSGMRVASPEG